MPSVGIDWAESFHDVALGGPGKGVIEQFRIDHGPAGVQRLASRPALARAKEGSVRLAAAQLLATPQWTGDMPALQSVIPKNTMERKSRHFNQGG